LYSRPIAISLLVRYNYILDSILNQFISNNNKVIGKIEPCVLEAGKIIMGIYAQDFDVITKSDKTPVTEADRAANEYIVAYLNQHFPEIPVISEESKSIDYSERKSWKKFFLVDPLDGTKEFIKKNGEFTVNIALIEDGAPIFGIVYAPAIDLIYYGEAGKGSFVKKGEDWQQIKASAHYLDKGLIKLSSSRSHQSVEVNTFIKRLLRDGKQVEIVEMGSSLKLCMVADGSADVYPRLGNTMEWDIAAGHAVIKFAGKEVYVANTKVPLSYNKESLLNPYFIAE
jgi:3'(2'), 5'-bisphosphate nucleotidase